MPTLTQICQLQESESIPCLVAVHAGYADAAARPHSAGAVGGLALAALLAVAEEEEGGDDGHRDPHRQPDHHELVHLGLFYA